jgi:hypothetical protein
MRHRRLTVKISSKLAILLFGAVFAISFAVTAVTTATQTPQPSGPGLLSPEEKASRFQAGEPWDGRGAGDLTEADLLRFADFPVLWFGAEVLGYNLQAILREKYDPPVGVPLAKGQDRVTLIYGRCTLGDDESRCPTPLAIHLQPACLVRPEEIAGAMQARPALREVRGGALVQKFIDGHVQLWTDGVTVTIHPTADPGRADELVGLLQGMGRTANLQPGADLPRPNFEGC